MAVGMVDSVGRGVPVAIRGGTCSQFRQNSPGHRPKACQTPSNNSSNPRYCSFRYWTQGFLEFRKDTWIVSLGGHPGTQIGCDFGSRPLFSRSKITPEIDHVFHRFPKPKGSPNPSQNHSKSIPGAIPKPTPKKSQNYTEPNPSKP